MKYRECVNMNIISIYKQHYISIDGGIDGYYEKTILDSQIYEIYTNTPIAFFSIHFERGLTSLVVLSDFSELYEDIFSYVFALPLFTNVLFTENDKQFMSQIMKNNIQYENQAYNFKANSKIKSSIQMKKVMKQDITKIKKEFGDFIEYNQISLNNNRLFYYEKDGQLISLGALEALRLNEDRYCISMIVSEKQRRQSYGCETVKFLVEYLQSNNLECNARCYVHNEASRKTLLKSGLYISNILYKAKK